MSLSADQTNSNADTLARLTAALAERYRILREIGAGGMATVYLAEDLRHHRNVAVKVLRDELASTLGPARFLREIEVAAQLQHPHILALLDSGSADGFLYYVMPYVESASLRERLAAGDLMPVGEVVRLLAEIVDALAEAHRHGLVHRDVKPDNVLLSGRHALLTDFGVAKAIDDASGRTTLTSMGVALGTPAYMAPEQATADPRVDHRADLYAVGALGYEMLTGAPPFSGSAPAVIAAHLSAPVPSMRARRPDISPQLEAVLLRCLEKEPDARWKSATELREQLDTFQTPGTGVRPATRPSAGSWIIRHRRALVVGVCLMLVGGIVVVPRLRAAEYARWVRETAIPGIEQHVERGEWEQAYRIAMEAQRIAPSDSNLPRVWSTFTTPARIETTPSGARVYRQAYHDTTGPWEDLGVTPIRTRYPYDPYRLRIEHAGFRPLNLVWEAASNDSILRLTLDSLSVLPEEMVRVPATPPGFAGLRLGDFFLDRMEITNREFKLFVDSGGYRRRDLWQFPFVRDGMTLSWESAMQVFVDRTGRPGPSSWEVGDYPKGQDRYPVGGVSWYEAAAYARFVRKDLPTAYHWRRAYAAANGAFIVPVSNIERDGPAPVGQFHGITRFGALDMAGNVREWCFNLLGDQRFILGGGWNDPDYLPGQDTYAAPPFDRSPTNGIRLARYLPGDTGLTRGRAPVIAAKPPDFQHYRPVSDDIMAAYRSSYAYDQTPLRDRRESADTTPNWIRERITFDAAYGHQRAVLYLFLPRNSTGPLQTVVYFPGGAAQVLPSIDMWRSVWHDFIVKSGRAFAFPVYNGTFERRDGLRDSANMTVAFRNRIVEWSKDLGRTLDYLGTRADIDTTRLAYFGYSLGGRLAPIMLVTQPRFKTAVLYIAGIGPARAFPEVDELTYASRVTLPVLGLSGRFDTVFPLETSATPMFQLLGTNRKRHDVSEGGHFVPRTQFIKATLAWLDSLLGPAR